MVILGALLRLLLAVLLALMGWIPLAAAAPPPAFLDAVPGFSIVAEVVSVVTGTGGVGGGTDEVIDDSALDGSVSTDEVIDDTAGADQAAEDAAAEGVVDAGTTDEVVDDTSGDEVVDASFGDEAVGDAPFEGPVDTGAGAVGDGVVDDALVDDAGATDSGTVTDDTSDVVDNPVTDTVDPAAGDGTAATGPAPSATPEEIVDPGEGPVPTDVPEDTADAETPQAPPPLLGFRLDDPVLQWLPELNNASEQTGVPVELLAALMRTTSNGHAGLQTTDGRFGLLFVGQRAFDEGRVSDTLRNDPQINTLTGAQAIARIGERSGRYDAALTRYFGSFCDVSGACTRDYIKAINAWTDFYAAFFADPALGGLAALPDGYVPTAIETFVIETLDGFEYPAGGEASAAASTDDGAADSTTPAADATTSGGTTSDPAALDTPIAEPAPVGPTPDASADRRTRRERRAEETPATGG